MAATQPISIRFATDTAGAKAGMQDLAASVVANMVKVSDGLDRVTRAYSGHDAKQGALFDGLLKHGQAFNAAAQASGGYANAFKNVAATVANDSATIGSAAWKAANEHNFALTAMGAATIGAARQTQTGTALMSAAWAYNTAPMTAKWAFLRNEMAATWAMLAASPVVLPAAAAIGGVLAIAMAIGTVNRLAEEAQKRLEAVMNIASGAEGAGVGTSFFQRWLGETKALNLEAGKLEDMLKRARAASTERIGEGDDASSSTIRDRLRQNVLAGNVSKGDAARFDGAKSQEDRIRVMLDLIEQLRAKGMQLAAFDLAGKFFGADFEEKLRSGVDMVGKMRASLDSTKAITADGDRVLTPQEVQRAAELKATIDETQRIMANALAPISRDIAAYQEQAARAAAEFNRNLAEVVATAGKVYEAVRGIGDALTAIGTWKGWDALTNILPRINQGAVVDMKPGEGGSETTLPAITVPGDKSKSLPRLGGRGASDAGGLDGIENYLVNLQKANDLARVELEMVGKSNVERAVATELVKAKAVAQKEGRDLTDDEVAKIRTLAQSTQELKDKQLDLNQALAASAEASRHFGGELVDVLTAATQGGDKLGQTLKSLASAELKNLLSALITGTGPLAGILGTAAKASEGSNATGGIIGMIAGAFRANGGPVQAGRAYTVGEVGREIFVPNQDGRMVPIDRNGAGGGGGGGAMVFSPTTTIDARGSQMSEAQLRQILDARDAENRRLIGQNLAAWRQRN